MEGGCLCLDLGEERGIFSRPEPTTGARRPHAFRRQYREEGHKTLVPAAPSRSLELLAGAPSRRANWPIALCTHPPLRRERCRCDPAITVKIEAKRGRYGLQRFAAIGVDDWLAGAIACFESTLAAFLRWRLTSPSSSLTNSVRTWPDRFQLNRGANVSRVFLFVS